MDLCQRHGHDAKPGVAFVGGRRKLFSALTKNDPFVLTKSDSQREHDLARANDCVGLYQDHPRRRRAGKEMNKFRMAG